MNCMGSPIFFRAASGDTGGADYLEPQNEDRREVLAVQF